MLEENEGGIVGEGEGCGEGEIVVEGGGKEVGEVWVREKEGVIRICRGRIEIEMEKGRWVFKIRDKMGEKVVVE